MVNAEPSRMDGVLSRWSARFASIEGRAWSRPPRTDLPPGPPGRIVQTLHYAVDAYGVYAAARARFGKTFTLESLQGTLVVTGDPALAREIFTAPNESFRVWSASALSPILGEASVLLSTGESHRRDRKLLTPPFHGARMRAYGAAIRESTRTAMAGWAPGETVTLQPVTQEISLDVIVQAVFGIEGADARAQWNAALTEGVASYGPSLIFFEQLRRTFAGVGPWARFLRGRGRIDAMIYEEIAARRSGLRAGSGQDVLSLLLSARYDDGTAMEDRTLRDQLVTLLVAGHETTATALAWAGHWLANDPASQDRLAQEIAGLGADADADAVAGLPFLDAVTHEVLRLYPIVPDIVRQAIVPLKIGHWTLQPGDAIAVATTLLHTDPDLYPEPHEFRPMRWEGKRPSPFEMTPFGGGGRRCLGAAFATYELKLALAAMLSAWRLEPAAGKGATPERRNITIGPRGGVRVVVHRRSKAA